MPAEILHFGPFRIDIANEQLWREGQLLPLQARAFAVLRYLVEHAGRLVTRQELTKVIWPDTVVSAGVLRGYIRTLRDILGDSAEHPQFIETVARRGYRFLEPVASRQPPVVNRDKESREWRPEPSSVASPAPSPQPLAPALVGREAELTQLQRVLEKALRGERQVLFITGEAGIGKTRLVERFLHPLTAAGDVWIGRGQCVEHYGAGEAYLPVLQALGQVGQGASGERLMAFLHQYAPTWLVQLPALLPPQELEAVQRRVAGATRERMLREMVDAVEALTAEQPLLMWLEDLHWADSSSLDWLMAVAQQRRPARLLVIGTYRPADISLGGHPLRAVKQELLAKGQGAEVWMPYLTAEEVSQYLTLRYPQNQFPAACGNAIHVSTDGNPLFMVNVVDELVSQGAIAEVEGQWRLQRDIHGMISSTPESLRQLIGKHVERLNETQRQLLEVASVVGSEFAATTVAAVIGSTVEQVEEQCEDLVERGQFLRALEPQHLPDGALTGRYAFLHALYQTVLYQRLPAIRRVRLHQRIGESKERLHGERARELAAELAMHFEAARDLKRAVQYLHQAAENALQRHAYQEAIEQLSKGLALLPLWPDIPERVSLELRLLTELGPALMATKGYAAPEVEKVCTRAWELCRQVGDTPQLFPVLVGLWRFYAVGAKHELARRLGDQLLALAQGTPEPTLLLEAHRALGATLFWLGEMALARIHMEQSVAFYDSQQEPAHVLPSGQDSKLACLSFAAMTLWCLGYLDQALGRMTAALDLARQQPSSFRLAFALHHATIVHQLRREEGVVQERAEELIALSGEQGFALWWATGTFQRGWALAEQGQVEEGITQLEQGLAAYQGTGAQVGRPYQLALLAEAYRKGGQVEAGLSMLDEALAAVSNSGERCWEGELYRLKGELMLARSSNQRLGSRVRKPQLEAEACFHKAIAIARQQEAKLWELRATMSLARLWKRQSKADDARLLLEGIYHWFTEGFDTKDLQDAKALLDEL